MDFTGTIQCDGYSAYPAFAATHARKIELVGCWAHARRNFYDAREHAPQHAGFILRQIGALYQIEARLRKSALSPKLRAAVRSYESRPIIERINKILRAWKINHRFLPKSTMGQAISYTLSQMVALEAYLADGRVEIDNNLVEKLHSPHCHRKEELALHRCRPSRATLGHSFHHY